ncbi:F-box domain-containing protein [Podospora conica]|nr:F-box domain-containing protein [Schizothecium conicum]
MDQLPPRRTSAHEAVSPPPQRELDEVAGRSEIDLDSTAATAQLACQASHHTLSTRASKGGTSGPEDTPPLSKSTIMSFSVAISPPIDAQPGTRTTQDVGSELVNLENGASSLAGSSCPRSAETPARTQLITERPDAVMVQHSLQDLGLLDLPTEVLLQILGNLEVCDLLAASRTSHLLRRLALAPILHRLRLRRTRAVLPPLLTSPSRPSLADLIRRSIFMTNTTVVSRKLARSLVSIRLQHRLATRPSPEALVARSVLPPECVPYGGCAAKAAGAGLGAAVPVAPALVARRRAVERERVKDGLRRFVGSSWRGEVRTREEGVRRWEERVGVGRVWRLRRFWERVANGEVRF